MKVLWGEWGHHVALDWEFCGWGKASFEDGLVVVDEELGHLIGVAWGQVGEEGGAARGRDDARGHQVHFRVCSNLQMHKINSRTFGKGHTP